MNMKKNKKKVQMNTSMGMKMNNAEDEAVESHEMKTKMMMMMMMMMMMVDDDEDDDEEEWRRW